ncbi:MAG: endonuclease III [Negativicutes bacterium]|nr:endonuclease III [Negativicutes bacterium]
MINEEARSQRILAQLERHYHNAVSDLNFQNAYELLVAVILSAQSTDKQVNQATKLLFAKAPDVFALAALTVEEIEQLTKGVGLFRNKSKNLAQMARRLIADYEGKVPATRADLETLPGVGRKTASVVLSIAFGIPALAVDTHIFRVANRMGLAEAKTPLQTEMSLCALIPREKWGEAHHWLIRHGRVCCKAKAPCCAACPVRQDCPKILE